MKTGIFYLFFIFLLFGYEYTGANYYSKAVSENDTIFVIVKKKNMRSDNMNINPILIPAKLIVALPDTTRDIIIIFRRLNSEDFNQIYTENVVLSFDKKLININKSKLNKSSVSNICNG